MYIENYKTLLKEILKEINMWKNTFYLCTGRLIL